MHSLRFNSGPVETNSLHQSAGAFPPEMAKWPLDPYKKTGVPFGLLGSSAPRAHARRKNRGPEEDIGSFSMRILRTGHQCMKQHNTSSVSDDSHIVSKLFHCRDLSWWRQQQQNSEVNGSKWGSVHPATSHAAGPRETKVATAQSRPQWKTFEHSFQDS